MQFVRVQFCSAVQLCKEVHACILKVRQGLQRVAAHVQVSRRQLIHVVETRPTGVVSAISDCICYL